MVFLISRSSLIILEYKCVLETGDKTVIVKLNIFYVEHSFLYMTNHIVYLKILICI